MRNGPREHSSSRSPSALMALSVAGMMSAGCNARYDHFGGSATDGRGKVHFASCEDFVDQHGLPRSTVTVTRIDPDGTPEGTLVTERTDGVKQCTVNEIRSVLQTVCFVATGEPCKNVETFTPDSHVPVEATDIR